MSDDATVCPGCGRSMEPEHAHYRCRFCGYRDTCCDGTPAPVGGYPTDGRPGGGAERRTGRRRNMSYTDMTVISAPEGR